MTSKKMVAILFVCALVMGSMVAGSQALAAEKVFKWKLVTAWPAGHPALHGYGGGVCEECEACPAGELKIQVLPGGAIAPALEVTDTVAKGIAEMGHSWPGYDIGRDQTTAILGGYAGGMESVPMMHWLYTGGGKELWTPVRLEKFGVVAFPLRHPTAGSVCPFPQAHPDPRRLQGAEDADGRRLGPDPAEAWRLGRVAAGR